MPLLVSETVTMFTCGSDGHISFQNEDTLPLAGQVFYECFWEMMGVFLQHWEGVQIGTG
jgi:hypothetical protein